MDTALPSFSFFFFIQNLIVPLFSCLNVKDTDCREIQREFILVLCLLAHY